MVSCIHRFEKEDKFGFVGGFEMLWYGSLREGAVAEGDWGSLREKAIFDNIISEFPEI